MKKNFPNSLAMFFFLFFVALFECRAQKPNIIFILSDDQPKAELGCYGSQALTPHIDSIAQNGIRFNRAYSVAPLCVPTRYSIMKGHYASRCMGAPYSPSSKLDGRVMNNTALEDNGLTLASVLKRNGYITGISGKWHLSHLGLPTLPKTADPADPEVDRILKSNQEALSQKIKTYGFDYAQNLHYGNTESLPNALAHHNIEWTTQGALRFINQSVGTGKPFFLYMAVTLTHAPPTDFNKDIRYTEAGILPEPINVQPPRSTILQRYAGRTVSNRMLGATWIDDGVGAVLTRLRDLGLEENTIVVYFSDQQTSGKATPYERGACVPLVMKWKNHIRAGQVSTDLVQSIDFLPTFCQLAGIPTPTDMTIDGKSFAARVLEQPYQKKNGVFIEMGYSCAITTQNFQYVAIRYPQWVIDQGFVPPTSGTVADHMARGTFNLLPGEKTCWGQERGIGIVDPDQLYDLVNDPGETVNLAQRPEYAEQLELMKQKLEYWLIKVDRSFGEFNPEVIQ
jgi:arylsulfatase A-like enzyme